MDQEEVIKQNKLNWASTIIFASEKDSSLRIFVDFRKLDVVTVRNSKALPKID